MTKREMTTLLGIALLGWVGGCAHNPPVELVEARQTYQRVSSGPAAAAAPAEVHKAAESLAAAEQAFGEDPEGGRARDLAYIAQRKALIAEALGTRELEARRKLLAEREAQMKEGQARQLVSGQLRQTREQLAQSERDRREQTLRQSAALDKERQAREQAEQNAAQAERRSRELLAALGKMADVKQEERGTVITLSGSVLFVTDQATLLPTAQTRLDQVAEALLSLPDRELLIEGHTDSRGSEGYNLALSQRRADAVRDYLVSRGYSAQHIRSQGIGKSRPVASNATAEGRANNRRVEIIIQPKRPEPR